ncbi:Major sperm protein [Caenorhabditis elegans]|uniref:Major sperm protein n=1 Tax=Caenorhabditis elegans TaxID=6239 RepID=Q18LB3_CAEEL|nr:Major sperm protein [Caenorhabditis elegans]CAK55187.1 Major sperm protein [Caenorhabditis elegans]|eukprot:NP_001040706.1 Major sperm protein [Caenorhabditis elegans]
MVKLYIIIAFIIVSISTSSPKPTKCGTIDDDKSKIPNLLMEPSKYFVFNGPFDKLSMDYFILRHPEFQRIAYNVTLKQSKDSKIFLRDPNGIIEENATEKLVHIGFEPFNYTENNKEFSKDKIRIQWMNVPKDASPDSIESCLDTWFLVGAERHTLKIKYNS